MKPQVGRFRLSVRPLHEQHRARPDRHTDDRRDPHPDRYSRGHRDTERTAGDTPADPQVRGDPRAADPQIECEQLLPAYLLFADVSRIRHIGHTPIRPVTGQRGGYRIPPYATFDSSSLNTTDIVPSSNRTLHCVPNAFGL